jgi:excisionase family DNA binding protein
MPDMEEIGIAFVRLTNPTNSLGPCVFKENKRASGAGTKAADLRQSVIENRAARREERIEDDLRYRCLYREFAGCAPLLWNRERGDFGTMSTLHHTQLEFGHVPSPSVAVASRAREPRPRQPATPNRNAALLCEDDQPLRINAVAAWLGVGDKTVRRRIDSGEIKSVKMGGLRVILRRDLRAYWQKLNLTGGDHV